MRKLTKAWLTALAVALVCAGCANGGAAGGDAGNGSIEMYGTIDQGISVHN
jgi:ABC-type glycerol-3-phosphate transport system substrate-binding protein